MKSIYRRLAGFALILFIFAIMSPSPARCQYDPKTSYKSVSKELEALRGLKFKKPVPYTLNTRQFIHDYLIKTFKQELPPAKLKKMETSLAAFGFVKPGFNLWNFLVSLYTEQVAGIYDYRTKSMLLLKDPMNMDGMEQEAAMMKSMGINMDELLLMHELQHSLQDQYFNLAQAIRRVESGNNDDATFAYQALLEGDAYIVMLYSVMNKLGGYGMTDGMDVKQLRDMMSDAPMGASMAQFQKAPLYFKRTLLFPYLDGMVFVDALKKKGGWEAVNRAFTSPPLSTEQIFHPERYFAGDRPVNITWKNLPAGIEGWNKVEENVLGELGIRILFEQFLPSGNFKSIADGWGGDRYRVYAKGQERLLIWHTTWDRQQDAKEFFQGYVQLLQSKYPGIKTTQKVPGKAYLGKSGEALCYAAINGKEVLAMEGMPREMAQNLIKGAWHTKKSQEKQKSKVKATGK
jgi:hypothetical protein